MRTKLRRPNANPSFISASGILFQTETNRNIYRKSKYDHFNLKCWDLRHHFKAFLLENWLKIVTSLQCSENFSTQLSIDPQLCLALKWYILSLSHPEPGRSLKFKVFLKSLNFKEKIKGSGIAVKDKKTEKSPDQDQNVRVNSSKGHGSNPWRGWFSRSQPSCLSPPSFGSW